MMEAEPFFPLRRRVSFTSRAFQVERRLRSTLRTVRSQNTHAKIHRKAPTGSEKRLGAFRPFSCALGETIDTGCGSICVT